MNHAITEGEIGFGIWDLTGKFFQLYENITSKSGHTFENLFDYIETIVYFKDKGLALKDLSDYLDGEELEYRSIFRIEKSDGSLKWVQLNGQIDKNADNLHFIIYDVTGDKLNPGYILQDIFRDY